MAEMAVAEIEKTHTEMISFLMVTCVNASGS